MDIMELGAIGELVCGVAVIASLLYVGHQVRHGARATRAASRQAISDAFNDVNIPLAMNAEVASLWRRGNEDRSTLSDDERVQYDVIWVSYMHLFETLFYQAQEGAADRQLFESEERSLRTMAATPGVREWWSENPWAFSSAFRRYIESLFSEANAAQEA